MKRIISSVDFYGISIAHIKENISPEFWQNAPHKHNHCEIFIHLKGEMDIFVEKSFYHIQKNCIRVYNSNELHYGKCSFAQPMEWYQISIPCKYFSNPNHNAVSQVLYNRAPGEKNVFFSNQFQQIVQLLEETFKQYQENTPLRYLYFQSAVTKILCILNQEDNNTSFLKQKNKNLQKLIDCVYSDFDKISTVNDLSRLTFFSPSYIHKIFKECMNITPYRFICDKKLDEAKKLLLKGHSVTYACECAGFNNYTNFITLFKNTFGITPKKYQIINIKNKVL